MNSPSPHTFLCNGASLPKGLPKDDTTTLEYRDVRGTQKNVNLSLPNFIWGVSHLPNRILDLLELTAYIFAADRFVYRGPKDAVEYQSWARSFHFVVKVRDWTE